MSIVFYFSIMDSNLKNRLSMYYEFRLDFIHPCVFLFRSDIHIGSLEYCYLHLLGIYCVMRCLHFELMLI